MSVIGELLLLIRQEQELTQEEFVANLVCASSAFKSLNAVTLSRWETGKTSTSYKKKRELLKIFTANGWLRNGPCHNYVRQRFETLCTPLIDVLEHNYQSLIANVPTLKVEMDEYSFHSLQSSKANYGKHHFEHILDVENASNPAGYYTATPESLQSLCSQESSFAIVCERKKQHLGHFLMFKLKNDVARDLIHNRIHEHSITKEHCCGPTVKGSYYIHALYGVNPTIAALLNSKAYIYLFDNISGIDKIVIFSSRKDGLRLAKAYGIKTVAKGRNSKCDFTWHGMESSVEDILFSDTVLRLVF
jgi:transcriptional regulator with XRE-family HTH domain